MRYPLMAAAILVMAGCAGRDATPVASYQSQDRDLACSQLAAEIAGNETKVAQLQREHDKAHDSNVAVGVVGAIVFWPALFALDTGKAQETEIAALRERNNNLARLQMEKRC